MTRLCAPLPDDEYPHTGHDDGQPAEIRRSG